jgi:hypothetical protein
MTGHNPWDTLCECLKAKPRRRVLTGLAATEPTETVHFTEVRTDESNTGAPIHAEYIHLHLPKLADAGYIMLDEQTYEISQGPRFAEIEPFLELVQSHGERLPDGWV